MGSAPAHPDEHEDVPLEARVPPTVLATPSDLRVGSDEPVTWWTPSWHAASQHIGYRWIYLLPAAGLLLLLVAAVFMPGLRTIVFVLEIKLLMAAGAIALTLAGYVVRRAVRARREPFCIHCGYNLTGLPDNYRCPECGRPYTWRLIAEYRRDPQWFVERFKAHRKLPPVGPPVEVRPARGPARRSRDGT